MQVQTQKLFNQSLCVTDCTVPKIDTRRLVEFRHTPRYCLGIQVEETAASCEDVGFESEAATILKSQSWVNEGTSCLSGPQEADSWTRRAQSGRG